MYNKEKEKERILQMLKDTSQYEVKYTKEDNFLRAIEFALDEVREFEEEYNKFISRVSHLQVFQDVVKEPLTKSMGKWVQNLKYLIEKNYTKEDREKMPADVLKQVKSTQDRRINLLKNVARTYFHRPKPD